ncbi:MAG TPA: cobyrinate a,c-diamide synthase [Actinoplanes sp.]|nr:cobyrinate a,c-diamide synthase [Actinoplanes sp.]
MTAQPRLVISAPSSGHGKTAIAVGVLAACVARGVPAAGFKVGPDHTDAAYLGLAAGRAGRNLDPRLVGSARIAPLFGHGAAGSQIAVIEGAMGLFDSLTGQPEIDGTAAVAAALRAPVVLVIDVATMGHSVAAVVHGFRMFDEMVHIGGVILNRVASSRHEQMLRTALDDIGMPVLGALRHGELPNALPARAYGPVPVAQLSGDAGRAVRRLGEAVGSTVDLDRLIALAGSAPALPGPVWSPGEAVGAVVDAGERPVIALAGGPGAPYTYVETAELLTAAGADVVVFDPLREDALPAGVRGLMIGAGLPEGYAEELSANRRLCREIARLADDGWPVVAEGVGLPWLTRDFDGRPMCAVLAASAVTGEHTVAGYREAVAPSTSPLAPAGARITGYKQHRAIVTPRAGQIPAWTWAGGNPEGFVWRQVHASQLGLHWAAAPEIARRLTIAATSVGDRSGTPMPHAGPLVPDRPGPTTGPIHLGPADGRGPADGHRLVGGHGPVERRRPAEGNRSVEGRGPAEGHRSVEGRGPAEGHRSVEGRGPAEGHRSVERRGQAEGRARVEGYGPVADDPEQVGGHGQVGSPARSRWPRDSDSDPGDLEVTLVVPISAEPARPASGRAAGTATRTNDDAHTADVVPHP